MTNAPMTPKDAIPFLEAELTKMKGDKDRDQLRKIPAYKDFTMDDFFELGYQTAIFDLKLFTEGK